MLLKQLHRGAADRHGGVSVPSIGSMLLKLGYGSSTYPMYVGFSTLYRVDAIEAPARQSSAAPAAARFSTLYRVDAIEAN